MATLHDMGEWSDQDQNSRAVALMRSGDPAQAATLLEELLDRRSDDLSLAFNLAWAHALAKNFDQAKNILNDEMIDALPQAALLDIQLLHDAGEFEAAGERAREYIEKHPSYEPLLAAVSVLALDIEDRELARQCAEKSVNHPDGLTSLATLTLGEDDPAKAKAMFEKALSINDQSPRAWIGLGLSTMAQGDHVKAGEMIDKGAGLFGDHLGSWIAAGWSYLLSGNQELARERFSHALELDDTFAESHGSLAVMDVLAGEIDGAKRQIEIAQRLDRSCFSAAFANVLIAAGQGDQSRAERIMELALKQPIGDGEGTLAEAIARMAQ
jgi:Tfp pilus assembly protein PilF